MIENKHYPPKKSLGQNFLKDGNIVAKIVNSLDPGHQDTVVEIGPGYGQLTGLIVPQVQHYIGVELDDRLVNYLQDKFGSEPGFNLIHADFLKLDFSQFNQGNKPFKLVGNVPYHITSPIIFKVIESRHFFQTMTLMIQKEVAQRIVATHGTKQYGILAVLCQTFSEVKILFNVSRHVFTPKPKVESAVVQWRFTGEIDYGIDDEQSFMRMVKLVFNQRRKQLRNSLKLFSSSLPENVPDEKILKSRPEDLSIKELVELWRSITASA